MQTAYGENKYVSRELGAVNADVQVKFTAGGNSWIPATGVFGAMSGAEVPRYSKQVQKTPCAPFHCRERVVTKRKWLGASGAG